MPEDNTTTPQDNGAEATASQPETAATAEPGNTGTTKETSKVSQPFGQDQINQTISSLVEQQLAPYQTDLQLLHQLRNGGKEQAPANPFEGELGLGELPDATKALYNMYQELSSQNRTLMAEKQERDYAKSLEDFTSNLSGILSDEKTLEAEMTTVIQNSPELAQAYINAVQGKGSLDAKFLNSLKKEMAWRIVSNLNDPNSGILDSLVERATRKNELRDQSMISSNQRISGQPSTNDGFSAQVTYDR